MRFDTLQPQVLRRPGAPLLTPSLVTNVVILRHRLQTSCVVTDRRRRLSALVDTVGHHFGRLVLSLATSVAKIVCFDATRQVPVRLSIFLFYQWPTLV